MSRPTTLKVDGTVYWAIMTYTDAGVLVDADSTPTVAVRKNGASAADAVTVTKRAATTGIYDCSHAPSGEAEGDCFSYEETATLSAQAYVNSWDLKVLAAERGTDSANTVAPVDVSASVADILADTNELQGNQSQWLTATTTVSSNMRGTDGANTVTPNTVTPVDVSADVAAILADTADLQANQGQWLTATTTVSSNMRGTDGANTVVPNTVAPDNASIAAILVDTADLQANQGQWLTATTTVSSNMRGTDSALLASAAPSNWSILSINGSGEITTSNPASGGGSAHTAQDVANLILVTPANKLATDASGDVSANNMRGTDNANTVTPVDVSASVALILADTSDLQSNQGQWLTATGFSTFDPASDTVAHVTLVDTTTDLTNGGGGGSCPTVQEIVDGWGNQPQNAYNTDGTLGYYLDAQVSSAGSGGTGLYQSTVKVVDVNGNALQGARVNVDGTTLTLTTGTSGEVTFNLDSGVYLLDVSPPANYDTPTSQVLTVTNVDPADTNFTLTTTTDPTGCSPPWIG